jgi:ubiquinone biosynthesis protein
MSDDLAGVFFRHRTRLNEIVSVLSRYGFARFAQRAADAGESGLGERIISRVADPDLATMSTGQRLRGVLSELGTTGIKFGQMLSLRPDLIGPDAAAELAELQSGVPADPPGTAERTIAACLGRDVSDVYGSFDPVPLASASVAQAHRASLRDGTPLVVKVIHDGARARVLDDLELMRALAGYLEGHDDAVAAYSPTVVVEEFDTMMRAAVDLREELSNLLQFRANFADEPDVVIPTPYQDLSGSDVLTMSLVSGERVSSRESVAKSGWDVDALVRRTSDVYLEMVFRDGIFHADPHPGNFLLPDGEHLAILDFGDVGRLTGPRKAQLEDLLLAIGSRDVEELTDVVIEITKAPADLDVDKLNGQIGTWLNRYLGGSITELDVVGATNAGMQIMHGNRLTFPGDLALLFRVMVSLQGLGSALGAGVSLSELLQPYLRKMAADRLDPRIAGRHAIRTLRGWQRLFADAPRTVRPLLQHLKDGTVHVELQIHDADGVADRITDGLLGSASLLAAAQLLSRGTGPRIGSVSAPGAVALAVGVLTWQRLIRARPSHRSTLDRAQQLIRGDRP